MANNTQSAEEKKAAKAAAKAEEAKKKAEAEEARKKAEAESQNGAPEGGQHGDQGEGGADDNEGDSGTPGETTDGAPEQTEEETLYSLEFLAAEYRVATWQAAALHRMMKWESGKKVSKKEYAAARALLQKRPLGR